MVTAIFISPTQVLTHEKYFFTCVITPIKTIQHSTDHDEFKIGQSSNLTIMHFFNKPQVFDKLLTLDRCKLRVFLPLQYVHTQFLPIL